MLAPAILMAATLGGCLSPVRSLAERADVVVAGRIRMIREFHAADCPPTRSRVAWRDIEWPIEDYFACGHVPEYEVQVTDTLRGVPVWALTVEVPQPTLDFPCADRPATEDMDGWFAVMFLEVKGGRFWLVDGPNGTRPSKHAPTTETIKSLREVLETVPKGGADNEIDYWTDEDVDHDDGCCAELAPDGLSEPDIPE